jgi:hypothetical protein
MAMAWCWHFVVLWLSTLLLIYFLLYFFLSLSLFGTILYFFIHVYYMWNLHFLIFIINVASCHAIYICITSLSFIFCFVLFCNSTWTNETLILLCCQLFTYFVYEISIFYKILIKLKPRNIFSNNVDNYQSQVKLFM